MNDGPVDVRAVERGAAARISVLMAHGSRSRRDAAPRGDCWRQLARWAGADGRAFTVGSERRSPNCG